MQNNIGSIIFPNEWGIGHEPAINISTALLWINPSGSATRNPGRNRMGRFVGSLTIVKGFVANWQGEEGDPIQFSGLGLLYHVRWNTYIIGGDKAEGSRAEGSKERRKVAKHKGIMTV
jgi:hypothetical protein